MTTVEKIASALGELEKGPLATIERLTNVLGEERALALLEETLSLLHTCLITASGMYHTSEFLFQALRHHSTSSKYRK